MQLCVDYVSLRMVQNRVFCLVVDVACKAPITDSVVKLRCDAAETHSPKHGDADRLKFTSGLGNQNLVDVLGRR